MASKICEVKNVDFEKILNENLEDRTEVTRLFITTALVWLWALGIGLLGGLLLTNVTYSPMTLKIDVEVDQTIIRKYPGFFNEKILASIEGRGMANFYYFKKEPEIYPIPIRNYYNFGNSSVTLSSKSARTTEKVGNVTVIKMAPRVVYKRFHLLKGSKVQSRIIKKSGLVVYVLLKGRQNFEKWQESPKKRKKRQLKREILGLEPLVNDITRDFEVDSTDDYYFIYYATIGGTTEFHAEFTIDHRKYDLRKPTKRCLQFKRCRFSVDVGAVNPAVVISSADWMNTTSQTLTFNKLFTRNRNRFRRRRELRKGRWRGLQFASSELTVRVASEQRVWTYVLVFGLCPILCAALTSMVIWYCCGDCEFPANRWFEQVRAPAPAPAPEAETRASGLENVVYFKNVSSESRESRLAY